MTRLGWTVVLGISGIIVIAAGVYLWLHARTPQTAIPVSVQATSTPAVNPATLSIYTSGEYGFALFYPSDAQLTDAYSSTTPASVPWRIGASNIGTPIVSIKDNAEEVRVGMSSDPKDIKSCTKSGTSETTAEPQTVGSTTWQKFTFQKIGTDAEAQVTSYRTVHRNSCYALELLQPLTKTAPDTGYTLNDTITSFSFAN